MKIRSLVFLPAIPILLGAILAPPTLAGPETPADQTAPAPAPLAGLVYDRPFFPDASYDATVPTPESLLGFEPGDRFTSPAQIETCLQAWQASSPRAQLVEYARSHEGRPLYLMIVTSAANQDRLPEIKEGLARLADPRDLPTEEADRLLATLPGVGWFAYSIHGNETSGADCALAVLYHLIAGTDPEVTTLLDDLVLIFDPLMNPDGRQRFFQQTTEHRGTQPNVDDQSLLHRGSRPTGRTNHYLFDLNRDWMLAVHPETRGRLRELAAWHPLLFVDGHEMGAQATYLFSPPCDPVNPHIPAKREHWGAVFARDQGAAFDRFGWRYYTGEWNEEWYVGYSSLAGFRGSLFILYEQARIAEDAVRRPEGTLVTYAESVHHQVTSTMANLQTLHEHSRQLQREFLAEKQRSVSKDSPYSERTFAILPTANRDRLDRFLTLMELHGIEVFTAPVDFTVRGAVDQLGRQTGKRTLPAGTILIPNRQPEAPLVAAMLEFDPRMTDETLRKERKELLSKGRSLMYDVTAWNLTMLFDLETLTLASDLPKGATRLPAGSRALGADASWSEAESLTLYQRQDADPAVPAPERRIVPSPSTIAWVLDGADDRSAPVAARLMERGVEVRLADKSFTFAGEDFARGTIVVTQIDNQVFAGDLPTEVFTVAAAAGLSPRPLTTGFGEGELPDLGGRHFRRLEPPRIGLLTRGGTSAYDYGAVWWVLDKQLGIRHSHLDESRLGRADLDRYNVLVLPNRWSGEIRVGVLEAIRKWVDAGGTLIAVGRSAQAIANQDALLGQVRDLSEVLDQLDPYVLAVRKEWLARTGQIPSPEMVWSHVASPVLEVPVGKGARKGKDDDRGQTPVPGQGQDQSAAPVDQPPESKKGVDATAKDAWLRQFMPQGAILAGRVDPEHWLTCGCGDYLPLLYGSGVGGTPVLMAADPVEAPVRFGYFQPADGGAPDSEAGEGNGPAAPTKIGWSPLPDGQELRLRMSGLFWPEAAHRLASSAYLTREPVGKGQIILFAAPPAFRAGTLGTMRLLVNAIVFGPGLGARQTIRP